MQSQTRGLNVEMQHLIKAAPVPLIVVAILSVLGVLGVRLGVFSGVVYLLAWTFCGVWYARTILQAGTRPMTIDLALNGALIGAAASLIDDAIGWIGSALRSNGYALDVVSWLMSMIYVGIIAALGAVAWYAYQTENR